MVVEIKMFYKLIMILMIPMIIMNIEQHGPHDCHGYDDHHQRCDLKLILLPLMMTMMMTMTMTLVLS